MTKLLSKIHLFVLLMAFITAAACLSVCADEFPDLSKNGSCSINVTLQDKSNEAAVAGGKLELIQVASAKVDNGFVYVPTGSFNNSDFTFDLSEKADLTSSDLAANIASYASKHGITGKVLDVGDEGTVSFSGLDVGLYLMIDVEPAPGYTNAKPFLISVPMRENGAYIYDVDASPKLERVSKISPVTKTCPPIRKVIRVPGKSKASSTSKEYMNISAFTFSFKRMKDTYPMPVNTSGDVDEGGSVVSEDEDELVIVREGEGKLDIGTITFTDVGDYYYSVKEIKGDGNYSYDTNSYVLKYTVSRNNDTLTVSDTQIRVGNANGEHVSEMVFTFTNIYRKGLVVNEEEEIEARKASLLLGENGNGDTPKKTGVNLDEEEGTSKRTGRTVGYTGTEQKVPKRTGETESEEEDTPPRANPPTSVNVRVNLPQTGQLWWPVWIMAGLGAAFLLIGILRRFTSH